MHRRLVALALAAVVLVVVLRRRAAAGSPIAPNAGNQLPVSAAASSGPAPVTSSGAGRPTLQPVAITYAAPDPWAAYVGAAAGLVRLAPDAVSRIAAALGSDSVNVADGWGGTLAAPDAWAFRDLASGANDTGLDIPAFDPTFGEI